MKGLSVIVPTLNEAENLPILIPRIEAAIRGLGPHEIVVVDDSSPDGTAEAAEGLSSGYPVRTLRRRGPRSLSGSVIDGAQLAAFDCLAVLDADLSHDPAYLPEIVSPVLAGQADVAIGSRYIEEGRIRDWPLHRRILSGMGTSLARLISRVRDPLSGYFSCRRDLLLSEVRACGYKVLLEVLGRWEGLCVVEVPTVFSDRSSGKSKLRLRQEWEFLRQVAALLAKKLKRLAQGAFPWASSGMKTQRQGRV